MNARSLVLAAAALAALSAQAFAADDKKPDDKAPPTPRSATASPSPARTTVPPAPAPAAPEPRRSTTSATPGRPFPRAAARNQDAQGQRLPHAQALTPLRPRQAPRARPDGRARPEGRALPGSARCRATGMWFEVHAENYIVAGGPRLAWLEAIRPSVRCRCTASRSRSPAPSRRTRRRWPGSRRWCGGSSRRWSRSISRGRAAARSICPTCCPFRAAPKRSQRSALTSPRCRTPSAGPSPWRTRRTTWRSRATSRARSTF